MKISIQYSDKSDSYWQDATIEIPDGSDIHDMVDAIACALLGVSFHPTSIINGFQSYIDEHESLIKEKKNDARTSRKSKKSS